ncbi:MAG: pyridoxal-phosphate dependent enzyme [Pseudomonadales bacterium]|nr:pyridoxal-phosphate dependent enzyme [Pseudomonadales bacterium]
MHLIFKKYPELKPVITVAHSALLPTPVQQLPIQENAWIKRDDLTHTEYGGNKIRKLEFILADAMARGSTRIVTFGAIGTNHGVATAMMCQKHGIDCVVYLFDQPITATVSQNLQLMQAYGATLIYKKTLFKAVKSYYLSPYRLLRGSYFLFAGGSNLFGTLGYINAAFELQEQINNKECPQFKYLFCPVGSSATLAGLTYGLQLAGIDTQVKGIRVVQEKLGPFQACSSDTVYQLMLQVQHYLQTHTQKKLPIPNRPVMDGDYFGDGYGVATKEGLAAIDHFNSLGIKLEQTYTGKAAAAFLRAVEQPDDDCLFWNTYNSRDMSKNIQRYSTAGLPAVLQKFVS